MSIPHIFLTSAGPSAITTVPISLKHSPSSISSDIAKEQIRERLNMHVKKRIQGHDMPQYPLPSSPVFSALPLSSAMKPTYPFLMSTGASSVPPMVVFTNSLIAVASDYSKTMHRSIPMPQIERQPPKKNQTKKLTKKKKSTVGKKNGKPVDVNQQAENLILNAKLSDDSIDYHERNEMCSKMNGSISPPPNNPSNGDISPAPSHNHRLNNTPDILSMVLSVKKNALMHDPYVIQFISSIR